MHFLLVILLFFFISCTVSPFPVFKLNSSNKDIRWYKGKELLSQKKDSIELAIYYNYSDYSDHHFYLDIRNKKKISVIFDPSKSFYTFKNRQFKEDTLLARNPEEMILAAELEEAQEHARHSGEKNTSALFSFLDLAGDIAEIGERKSEEEKNNDELRRLNRQVNDMEEDLYHERNLNNLGKLNSFWSHMVMRKMTIPGNTVYSGRILFPVYEKTGGLELHITILGTEFTFKYQQKKYSKKTRYEKRKGR